MVQEQVPVRIALVNDLLPELPAQEAVAAGTRLHLQFPAYREIRETTAVATSALL